MALASFTVKLEGLVDLNGLTKEALEDHLRREMVNAIGNGLITGHTEAEVDEYRFDVSVTEGDSVNPQSKTANYPEKCPNCHSDLTQPDSVTREYVNKDPDSPGDGSDSVYALGHYDDEGAFESDSFGGFGGGNFDLKDDSDSCSVCDMQL